MGSDTKKTISFCVDSAEEKAKINSYAKSKGLQNASNLARLATYQYMARFALKPVQRDEHGGGIPHTSEDEMA
jgi:hypothetical protein